MHNGNFWGSFFRRVYVPHLARLHQTLDERLLPTFVDISAEADQVRDEAYERYSQMPAGDDCDPSWPAEMAQDAGLDHYMGMKAIRQTILNAFAPILYHAWEQQLLEFHARELLHPREEHIPKLWSVRELTQRLMARGIDVLQFSSWATVEELKHVANAVKHAEGTSASIVRRDYPQLFEDPALADFPLLGTASARRVFSPPSGDDIFVRETDLARYKDALVGFWNELASAATDA